MFKTLGSSSKTKGFNFGCVAGDAFSFCFLPEFSLDG
jgi:hypothetical protein